jgi:hypothetical protein
VRAWYRTEHDRNPVRDRAIIETTSLQQDYVDAPQVESYRGIVRCFELEQRIGAESLFLSYHRHGRRSRP